MSVPADELFALSPLVGPAGAACSVSVISAQSFVLSAEGGIYVRGSRMLPPWPTIGKPPRCGQVIRVRLARDHIQYSSCLLTTCAAGMQTCHLLLERLSHSAVDDRGRCCVTPS